MSAAAEHSLFDKRVWVAGHRGLVGQALLRRLETEPCEVLTVPRARLDLTDQSAVAAWVAQARPDVIVVAAAKVGGIGAHGADPVGFLQDNLLITTNILRAAHAADVPRLLLIGSSAIYPPGAAQPLNEDSLFTGPLEASHAGYALAKIAGLQLCAAYRAQHGRDWISALPTNLYGPGDHDDPQTSHVLPALLRKLHMARARGADRVTLWGTGTPLREFLHCDDLADALVFLLKRYSGATPLNVGSGEEISIRGLAEMIAEVVGCRAEIRFDPTKPDGAPRKFLDCRRLQALGWAAARPLRDGISDTYDDWRRSALQEA